MNEAIRSRFPVLETAVYLNANATGAFPAGMQQVLKEYGETLMHWRDAVWERWLVDVQAHADSIASWIGGPAGSVITDANMSTLLGRLASSLDYAGERNRVVITDKEFPTVPFLWKAFERLGAELVVVPCDGDDPESALEAAIDERTCLVNVSHADFRTGTVLDISRIARKVRQAGALLAVDAYQSVGAVPVDVTEMDVDFLLGGAHKWMCGSNELGWMYVRPSVVESLRPTATGWVAGSNPFTFEHQDRWAPDARRFGAGTPLVLPALLSVPGMKILEEVGASAIREHSLALTERIFSWAEDTGVEVLTPRAPSRRAGIVSLSFPGEREVAVRLIQRNMICTWRGALRIAPHFYNTVDEVDRFLAALDEERREVAP